MAIAILAVSVCAGSALAQTRVLEATLAPGLDLDPDSPRYREPVGGVSLAPPCGGDAATLAPRVFSQVYLWLRLASNEPVRLTATWNHLPEGEDPADMTAWRVAQTTQVNIPTTQGFRIWLLRNMDRARDTGRFIVTIAADTGEVVCSVPFVYR
ncbi:hypothetical protein [Alkalidesulfovibrio alkalitolerans]|nr:hypothetical protein [Alkalidesulfovibrio alkalitolerans]